MAVEYRENPAGIAAMLRSDMVADALRARAEEGKRRAEQLTPVDTGRMKASWVVTVTRGGKTVQARLANTARDPQTGFNYPAALEFGTRYIRKRRILGRAIDSMAAGN